MLWRWKTKYKQRKTWLFCCQSRCQTEKQTKEEVLTDLEDDDEGQSGSQDVPELQGELVGLRAPGWSPVVPVPAESGLVGHAHLKHRQAAVHVASQTPGGTQRARGGGRPQLKRRPPNCAEKNPVAQPMLTRPLGSPRTGRTWRRRQSAGCSLRWWRWQRHWWWPRARRCLPGSHARCLLGGQTMSTSVEE